MPSPRSCFFSKAVVTVTFEGEFKSCDNGMELFGWDMSKLDILMMDNENITLNGKLEYTAEYKSPMTVSCLRYSNHRVSL